MFTRPTCALTLLCFVQGCERFAFFVMLPLMALYLHRRHGLTESAALLLLGVFHTASYLGTLPAGAISDRWLGRVPAALLGAALLTAGYAALAIDRPVLLWPALGLMVLGHSFFKPNLQALVGQAYTSDDPRRERAFLLNYFATNLGGIAGPLVADRALDQYGWSSLFCYAAFGMCLGASAFAFGRRLFRSLHPINSASSGTSCTDEHQSMSVVWLLCGVAVVFWLTAQQPGSVLALFAAENTEPHLALYGHNFRLGPGHFAALHSLLVVLLLPLFLMASARSSSAHSSTPNKMVLGYVVTGAAFALLSVASLQGGDAVLVSPSWLAGSYVLLSVAELLLAPLGMSLLTRMAPRHKLSQTVGLWFTATAVGNAMSGGFGLLWTRWPHHRYFALLALLSIGAAAVLLSRLRRLEKLTATTNGADSQPLLDEISGCVKAATLPYFLHAVSAKAASISIRFQTIAAFLFILLPISLAVSTWLPIPVRAVSSILCGVALLTCGPFLIARVIDATTVRPSSSSTA